MSVLCEPISDAQIVAYELASHELGRLLDDAAALIWSAIGEHGVLGRLADEARWAAFLVHDRIARHAVQNGLVREDSVAIRPLRGIDRRYRAPNRFGPELREPLGGPHHRLAAALRSTKAALVGMSGGYARAYPSAHAIMEALRDAEAAVDALAAELARMEPRAREAASAPSWTSDERHPRTRLVLLHARDGAPRRAETRSARRRTPLGT